MSKENEIKRFKKYSVSKKYNDHEFNIIYGIFCTYRSRGGLLTFHEFASIPFKRDQGNIGDESGVWNKYIRNKLAHEWDAIKH